MFCRVGILSIILVLCTFLLGESLLCEGLAAEIHTAARTGELQQVQSILATTPAALDQMDSQGQTPLHQAIIGNHGDIARYLVASGAALDEKDRQGRTPLYIALDRGRTGSAIMLLDAGADHRRLGATALHMGVRTGNLTIVRRMLASEAPVNATNRRGETPLVLAIKRNQNEMAILLLQHGADPVLELDGGTPVICWAAANGRQQIVTLLVENGADLEATGGDGHKAIDLAARHGHQEIVAFLQVHGQRIADREIRTTAQWLAEPLQRGEAVLWHLGHCGWAIKTRDHLLVFDYVPSRHRPATPGLASGFLVPTELQDQKVTVLVTHGHGDHFSPAIYPLAEGIEDIRYIYGFEPGTSGTGSGDPYRGPRYTYTAPHTHHEIDGLQIATIESNDQGVGFLVTVDGFTIYHAGDHAGWREDARQGFTAEIDTLEELGRHIDVAFLNVTGCHTHGECPLEDGTRYTLEHLAPERWFPTHAGDREHVYREFAAKAEAGKYPSTIIVPTYRGDHFAYRRVVR